MFQEHVPRKSDCKFIQNGKEQVRSLLKHEQYPIQKLFPGQCESGADLQEQADLPKAFGENIWMKPLSTTTRNIKKGKPII